MGGFKFVASSSAPPPLPSSLSPRQPLKKSTSSSDLQDNMLGRSSTTFARSLVAGRVAAAARPVVAPVTRRQISTSLPTSFKQSPRLTTAAVALLATGALFAATSSSEPLEASTASLDVVDPNDPLSALSPSVLHAATSHLQSVGVSDLIRQYVVYLGSSQAALVEAGPWMLKKLEWARANVPLLGSAIWGFFSIVRDFFALVLLWSYKVALFAG